LYILVIIVFALAILIIRVLIHKGHKESAKLPIFKSNYVQAICVNDDCHLNEKRYYPPDSHNKMLILLHRLTLRPEDLKENSLNCPWCSASLTIEPLGPLFKSPPPGEKYQPLPWDRNK